MDPQDVIDWVEHHVEDRAEAVFLAGNGFRAAQTVEELELLKVCDPSLPEFGQVLRETHRTKPVPFGSPTISIEGISTRRP